MNDLAWRGALTLGEILAAAGIEDLDDLLAIRHTFKESGLPSLESVTPERILAYTRRQHVVPGKFPASPPKYWLVFLADGKFRSRLYGTYDNHGEVHHERTERNRLYDLRPSDLLASLADRLVIDWSADTINWAKRGATAASFRVVEISDRDAVPFPGFDTVSLSHAGLREVVMDSRFASWRTALGAVQGIYVISDATTGKLYVGKADGGKRILGRWSDYAQTGHGGNLGLRQLLTEHPDRLESLTWSILRVFGSSEPPDAIDKAEEHFKRTLLSREFGYNSN